MSLEVSVIISKIHPDRRVRAWELVDQFPEHHRLTIADVLRDMDSVGKFSQAAAVIEQVISG